MRTIQTRLERSFDKYEASLIRKVLFQPTTAWAGEQRTEVAKAKRIKESLEDFWKFDKTYFPPEVHAQGYSKAGRLHKDMFSKLNVPGIHWFLAHRGLAKSAYAVKMILWLFFRAQINILGVYTSNLTISRKIMETFKFVVKDNPRIFEDFAIEVGDDNEELFSFKCNTNAKFCIISPFSPKRSPRGYTVAMNRPDMMLFDDVETLTSSFDAELVDIRISKMVEAFKSLKQNGVAICLGNNLHPKCAANLLLKEQLKGKKREYITIYPYPDWSNKRTEFVRYIGSVWKEAYPAKSEAEMRKLRMITDEEEWSQAQCDPKKKGGIIFPSHFYNSYKIKDIPTDARGVAYCDQNLSLRGKGDSTVFGALLYSPSQNKFFAYKLRCKSYSDPNELLSDYFSIFDNRVCYFAMDGNVAQESSWTANLNNWSLVTGKHIPYVDFKRYSADSNISLAQMQYTQGLVYFEEKFRDTPEGESFFEQFFGFSGKKAGKKDDAADWFICCYSYLLETGFVKYNSSGVNNYRVQSIKPKFSF